MYRQKTEKLKIQEKNVTIAIVWSEMAFYRIRYYPHQKKKKEILSQVLQ